MGGYTLKRKYYTAAILLLILLFAGCQPAWQETGLDYNNFGTLVNKCETKKGTCNAKNEQSISGWRPDHITIDGNLTAESFKTVRDKYPTADGTEHYPSDHFPIVAELKF